MRLSVIIPTLDGAMPEGLPYGDERLEVVAVEGVSPVGEARNEGLEKATGEYIAWVDSDDAVSGDWLDEIWGAIKEEPDVISFDARVEWHDGSGRRPYRVGGIAKAEDVMAERATGQMWNKVIRRGLFEGLRFEGAAHEDYGLLCELLPRAKTIVHIGKELYVYRRGEKGLSQHVDREAGAEALRRLVAKCEALEAKWRGEMAKGVVQRIADFGRRCGKEDDLRRFVRRNLWGVVMDGRLSARVKIKALMAI